MSKYITPSQLAKLKLAIKTSAHNPVAIAKYTEAKRQYDGVVTQLFTGDYRLSEVPTAGYVHQLQQEAASGDPLAEYRYAIIKDLHDSHEGRHIAAQQFKADRESLRQLLASGEAVTDDHVEQAKEIAAKNPSLENLAVSSGIKKRKEAQDNGTYVKPVAPEPRKVTQEDVKDAYDKAFQSHRPQDITEYTVLKRELASQEGEKA